MSITVIRKEIFVGLLEILPFIIIEALKMYKNKCKLKTIQMRILHIVNDLLELRDTVNITVCLDNTGRNEMRI